MTLWTLSALVAGTLATSVTSLAAATAKVDYVRDVKPILTQHCVRCHGAEKEEAGLRVDTAEAVQVGGDSGPLVKPGRPNDSLLVQVVVGPHEDIPQMPYKKPALTPEQVATLRAWITDGAVGPAQEEPGRFVHWSFVAPKHAEAPAVKRADWPRNAIDNFSLARLEKENIAPSPEADRVTLLRRASLDLTGLPPTPAEVSAFLADKSPKAYESAVERLLASPHYGERWARPWLDIARYSDSNGYSIDAPRQIWKYRDWVVTALNRDQPFDQFVIEQLAGDLLANPTLEQKVATGFNRNTQINQEGGIDPEQFRIEAVMDRVNTYSTGFLGLTVACAQCHDHKFDPIKQKEYFQFYAFFNNTVEDGHGKTTPGAAMEFPDEKLSGDAAKAELDEQRGELERFLNTNGNAVSTWIATLDKVAINKFRSATAREAVKVPWGQMTLAQKRAIYALYPEATEEFKTRNKALTTLEGNMRKPVTTLVMSELPKPRESFLFIKGDFTRKGENVTPGTLAVLPPLKAAQQPNRLDLARWTVDPANPLTARVFVNRIWQQYFGRGIVETENDFGTQGEPPTHPELLDWLATELVAQKWSMKAMHRLIVTSATYRQSSNVRPDLDLSDPLNKLLARQTRLRLDAEVVRDVALASSGLLAPKLGGPPVFPPQPAGVMTLGQSKRDWTASKGEDRYRRGLYTHLWRATPHPAFAVFDAPDGFTACTRRLRSNTPLQALTLLNDEQFYEFAGALAKRVQAEAKGDVPAQIRYAFQLCLSRPPAADETARLVAVYEQQLAAATGDDATRRNEAWTIVARVLLNLDETITRE
ncbi:MAG: PSD1 and planctomycete cytochrome C domain-containing protein [Verrucomicrobiota bacterium]